MSTTVGQLHPDRDGRIDMDRYLPHGVDDVSQTSWHRPFSSGNFEGKPIEQLPIHTLHRTQDGPATLRRQRWMPEADEHDPVRVIRHEDTNWLYDGHHRVVHALDEGQTHIPARVWDLDQQHRSGGLRLNAAAPVPFEMPTQRLFGPTYGLDHRLFDGQHLKPDVRDHVLRLLSGFWTPQFGPGWPQWSRVYFSGSEASEWTSAAREGNNDFDVLVGVDYDHARASAPQFAGLTDAEITAMINQGFRVGLIPHTDPSMMVVDGQETGPWSMTWFCNPASYDIRDIRPYAAYELISDQWWVRPPNLPEWDLSKFPEGPGLTKEIEGVITMAEGILAMPEPYRTQNGAALWEYIHESRAGAFGTQGEGWWDARNAVEKACDQRGLMQLLWECHHRSILDPHTLDSPADWSNDPATLR